MFGMNCIHMPTKVSFSLKCVLDTSQGNILSEKMTDFLQYLTSTLSLGKTHIKKKVFLCGRTTKGVWWLTPPPIPLYCQNPFQAIIRL